MPWIHFFTKSSFTHVFLFLFLLVCCFFFYLIVTIGVLSFILFLSPLLANIHPLHVKYLCSLEPYYHYYYYYYYYYPFQIALQPAPHVLYTYIPFGYPFILLFFSLSLLPRRIQGRTQHCIYNTYDDTHCDYDF